jgi:hypothetical protein
MTSKPIAVAAVLAVIALTAAAVSSGAPDRGGDSLHAALTGKVEVPRGDPDGAGTAEVKIDGRSVCWELKAVRVATLTAAHIHRRRPGTAGPVVVPFGASFRSKGCTNATAAVAAAIRANPSAYYVNVHNARYPGGALRGQLRGDD